MQNKNCVLEKKIGEHFLKMNKFPKLNFGKFQSIEGLPGIILCIIDPSDLLVKMNMDRFVSTT